MVVLLDYPASETLFGNELERGLEEIDVEPQPLVKRGQNATGFKTFKPVVADDAANDGSVFLFDVALIVLFVGPTPGKRNRFTPAILEQRIVDELLAVVGVESEHRERDQPTGRVDGLHDNVLLANQQCQTFGPTRVDIGHRQGVEIATSIDRATVSHEIGFEESRFEVVPVREGA